MKKNRGDEPIGITTHTYMKMPQGNSLHGYFKEAKMSVFFSLQNWRTVGVGGRTGPAWKGWYQWEWWGRGMGR
jgi:hypothetical protein